MYAPALKAAAPTVFMFWLRPFTKACTYTQYNKNTDHSQTLIYIQVGLDSTIPVSEAFHSGGLVSIFGIYLYYLVVGRHI
jgi:hypothetical protein